MDASCVTLEAIPAVPEHRALSALPQPTRDADGELVARSAQGDRAAQRALFARLRPQVYRHVGYLVRRRAEVDDIAQEVLLEIFRSLPSFAGRSSLGTWVHRITVRATYRHLRRQWKGAPPPELACDEPEPQAAADPAANAEIRDRQARVFRLLERLSPKKRMVLVLHDLQGVEAADIARLVGAPVLTVRTRLFYARKELAAAARGDPALAEFFGPEPEAGGTP
ncbi:MAG: RNA polymerase sigma factor [Myxococcales bacterium]